LKPVKLKIIIYAVNEKHIGCHISDEAENNQLNYFLATGNITFTAENQLAKIVRKNLFQFEKVLRSAIKGKLTVGQTINCVFIEGFNFLTDDDFTRFIKLDRRDGRLEISTSENETEGIHKIYGDGSFACETRQSGYGGFIETPDGKREVFNRSFNKGSNNLMELLAITEGLQRLLQIEKIQINTDSRFVIRGLIQWVHFWRHNNWQTAYGCEVKFAECWQQIDRLCEGKLIEFNWIKGHSGNKEQDFCDQLARKSASQPGSFRIQ
jgi:ribonuclease HI